MNDISNVVFAYSVGETGDLSSYKGILLEKNLRLLLGVRKISQPSREQVAKSSRVFVIIRIFLR